MLNVEINISPKLEANTKNEKRRKGVKPPKFFQCVNDGFFFLVQTKDSPPPLVSDGLTCIQMPQFRNWELDHR